MYPDRLGVAAAALGLLLAVGCTQPTASSDLEDVDGPGLAAAQPGHAAGGAARAAANRSWGGHSPRETTGLVAVSLPDEHPGVPLYARVGYPDGFPEGQILEDDGRVVVVFYRDPSCVPADFNLLDFFHFPGPDGPGAWGCPSYHSGTLYVEPDASPTTFPKVIDLQGEAVPVWAIDAQQFHAAAADGVLTMPELTTLDRVERTVSFYDEHLHARNEDHFIGIEAKHDRDAPGFRFQVVFEGVVTSEAERIQLQLR